MAKKKNFIDQNVKQFLSIKKQRKLRNSNHLINVSDFVMQNYQEQPDLSIENSPLQRCLFESSYNHQTKAEKLHMLKTLTQGLQILK